MCQSGADQVCERQFECQSDATKSTREFRAYFGESVEECKTMLYTGFQCSERREDNDNCTDDNAGKKFDLGKASDCSSARAKLSCADYLGQFSDPSKSPAVCAQVCQ